MIRPESYSHKSNRNDSAFQHKHDYLQLLFLSLSSFGSHFSRHGLAVLGIYMIETKIMTAYGLGVLFAAISLPSCFLPLFIGLLIDSTQNIFAIGSVLLLITCCAEILLTMALSEKSYSLAIISQLLLGCGATSFTTIQRTMITFYLKDHGGLGMALCIAVANASKVLGKVSIVPLKEFLGTYPAASSAFSIICLFSYIAWVFFNRLVSKLPTIEIIDELSPFSECIHHETSSEEADIKEESLSGNCRFFSFLKKYDKWFYILACLHTLYTTLFHILLNFLPHYATVTWEVTEQQAALISSLPAFIIILCSPIVGFLLDHSHLTVPLCGISSLATVSGYYMIFKSRPFLSPAIAVAIIAFSHSTITTYTLSEISRIVPRDSAGTAFGIIEIIEALGGLLGNYCFGLIASWMGYNFAAKGIIFASAIGALSLFISLIPNYSFNRRSLQQYLSIP